MQCYRFYALRPISKWKEPIIKGVIAKPPKFPFEQPAPNKLIMKYISHRGLHDIFRFGQGSGPLLPRGTSNPQDRPWRGRDYLRALASPERGSA